MSCYREGLFIKGKYVVAILVVLLVIFGGVRYFSSYQAKQDIENDTITHLKEHGYQESEIDSIDVVNVGGNKLQYAAVITFADEPDVDYLYTYKNDSNQIIQIDAVNKGSENTMKHLENKISSDRKGESAD